MSAQARQRAYRKWMESGMEWEHIRQAAQQARVIGQESFQREIEH